MVDGEADRLLRAFSDMFRGLEYEGFKSSRTLYHFCLFRNGVIRHVLRVFVEI